MLNPVHLHLALNHVPVVGLPVVALLLAYALWRKHEEFTRVALAMVALLALAGVPAYFSGEEAEERIEHLPGVSEHLIHEHEEAAEAAFAGLVLAGIGCAGTAAAWVRLKEYRFKLAGVVLVLVLVVSLLLVRTAFLGGQIRHPEIRGHPVLGTSGSGHAGATSFLEHEDEDDDD